MPITSPRRDEENYEGNVFSQWDAGSFLSPWKGMKRVTTKFDGRFNMGCCKLNSASNWYLARGSEKYFEILDKRLELGEKALLRYNF